MDVSAFAEELFREVTGGEPPKLDRVDWPKELRYKFVVHEQDGNHPLYRLSGRTIHLWLHTGQNKTWKSTKRFIFMIAGKQSGKTIFGPVWLLNKIMELGRGDYLAVSASFELFNLKMLPELKKLFVETLGIARYWAGSRILEIANPVTGEFGAEFGHEHEKMWGRIILRTAASEEGLQSATAKAAWLDEPGLYSPDAWKDIRGRLSLHRGPALGTTTPYDLGWLKQLIFDKWEAGDPEIDVIRFASIINPFFSKEEFESLRASMQSWQFRMDYEADFGRPPGVIYEDYVDKLREEGGHVVRAFDIPRDWPRYVAIDPGIVNPGKLWAAHDVKQNVYYLYREEKGGERLTSKEHAKKDVEKAIENNERVICWAIGAKSEKYWREDYQKAGAMGVKEPDVADVEEGIDRGTYLIKQHRMFVFEGLHDVRDEFNRYAREVDPVTGLVTEKIRDKSTFHLIDAYRYLAVQVAKIRMRGRGKTKVRNWNADDDSD